MRMTDVLMAAGTGLVVAFELVRQAREQKVELPNLDERLMAIDAHAAAGKREPHFGVFE